MKIIVDSKEINRAWQSVAYGRSEDPRLLEDADKLLLSILDREDNEDNNVERILDDAELKYLRILEKDRTQVLAVQAVQEIRKKMGVKSITDENRERELADIELKKNQDALNDTMHRLKEAANNWKPNDKEGCIRLEESLHKQAVHEELNNKYIIVEILDMLIEEEKRKTWGLGGVTFLQRDAEELRAKLVGND